MTRARFLVLLCVLACAPFGGSGPEPVTWRVTTYNIHHAAGMDEKVDVARVAAVLERTDADVIALQEVDERVERSGRVDQAAQLAERLGMQHAFGSFMNYQGGRYGVAVLSKHPILRTEVIRLPEGNEPRVALAVTIERSNREVTVVSLHFDWVEDDRFRYAQATELTRWLDRFDGPWILAGDFNDEPGSPTLRLFTERALEAAKPERDRFTFSSTEPEKEIDFIFAAPRDEWRVREARVIDERMASDHRPVTAVLVHTPRAR